MATVTSEKDKMLAFGERLREDPKTIWFSVPVLGFAVLLGRLTGNKEREAGGSGHLGLAFRLLYKHHWKQPRLLDIAYSLFSNAARIGTGNGQPSVRMAMGGVMMEKGEYKQAYENFLEGFEIAKKQGDFNQAAFLRTHVGIAQMKLGSLGQAKKNLDEAMRTLRKALAKNKQSLYLQVWMSNAELGMSEWYLAVGDKRKARVWAGKVAKRAQKWELRTREQDAKKLLRKIASVGMTLLIVPLRHFGLLFNKITP